MSAEVSFTKRAAAELSRCFNGLTVSRSGSKKNSTTSTSSSSSSSSSTSTTANIINNNNQSNASSNSNTNNLSITSPASSSSSSINVNIDCNENNFNHFLNNNKNTNNNIGNIGGFNQTKQPNITDEQSFILSGLSSKSSKIHVTNLTCPKKSDINYSKNSNGAINSNQSSATKLFNSSPLTSSSSTSTITTTTTSPSSNINLTGQQSKLNIKSETLISKTNSTTISPFRTMNIVQNRPSLPGTPKRVPPQAPPKTSIARRKNYLLNIRKPRTQRDLWLDEQFLTKLFNYFQTKERCLLAQVCAKWRDILYSNENYWKSLIPVIYCTELRRYPDECLTIENGYNTIDLNSLSSLTTLTTITSTTMTTASTRTIIESSKINIEKVNKITTNEENIKSSSIRMKLYESINRRGFDSICLFGATDADVIDLASKISTAMMKRCVFASLRCSSVSDKGLEIFLATFNQSIKKLELTGCNEITDSGLWTSLVTNLESLTICDCINIADETIAAITQMLTKLKEFTIQAYHITDMSMTYFGPTAIRDSLTTLRLQHCWEISNQGVLNIAHGLPNLTNLCLSGCSKVTDDAIEVIAEQLRSLKKLDLSWCSRISDASLEYIACDLSDTLIELNLDRSQHITDIGLGYIATMSQLSCLSLRWCPQIRDFGLQTLCSMKSLKVLSLAGCPQLTINGLSCLIQMQQLIELELTNCAGSTKELVKYLKDHLSPSCLIIV